LKLRSIAPLAAGSVHVFGCDFPFLGLCELAQLAQLVFRILLPVILANSGGLRPLAENVDRLE
jgi:hypothetical protein